MSAALKLVKELTPLIGHSPNAIDLVLAGLTEMAGDEPSKEDAATIGEILTLLGSSSGITPEQRKKIEELQGGAHAHAGDKGEGADD